MCLKGILVPSLDQWKEVEGDLRLLLLDPVCWDPQPSWRSAVPRAPPPMAQLVVDSSGPSGGYCDGLDLLAPWCGGHEDGTVRHLVVAVPVLHHVALACHF